MLRLMTSATTAQSSRHYSLGDWIANYTLASQLPSECRVGKPTRAVGAGHQR